MLTIIYGNDENRVRDTGRALVARCAAEGCVIQELSSENYIPGALRDFVEARSLFGERQALFVDTPSLAEELMNELVAVADTLNASENMCVVIERTLLAEQKKKFTQHAAEMIELKMPTQTEANPFALADALALRDKKQLWTLLQDAKMRGRAAEEIIGTLFWQLKMLRLAEQTGSAEEAGQKPYVFQKAKRALGKFKKGELDQLSKELIALYHDGHSGKRDIDLALEKWALTL